MRRSNRIQNIYLHFHSLPLSPSSINSKEGRQVPFCVGVLTDACTHPIGDTVLKKWSLVCDFCSECISSVWVIILLFFCNILFICTFFFSYFVLVYGTTILSRSSSVCDNLSFQDNLSLHRRINRILLTAFLVSFSLETNQKYLLHIPHKMHCNNPHCYRLLSNDRHEGKKKEKRKMCMYCWGLYHAIETGLVD